MEHKPAVYIESTIPSYLAARPARDLIQAARQQETHEWWYNERQKYRLVISGIVIDEISAGDPEAARRRLEVLEEVSVLDISQDVEALSNVIMRSGVLPSIAARDSLHIAAATVHGADYLLTWNCTHIANATIWQPIRKIVEEFGFEFPTVCTPPALMQE